MASENHYVVRIIATGRGAAVTMVPYVVRDRPSQAFTDLMDRVARSTGNHLDEDVVTMVDLTDTTVDPSQP